MATIPTVPSMPAGYIATAADMNALVTAAQFLYSGKPIAKSHGNSNQSLSNSSRTTINFPVKNYDTDGMWSAGNPGRLTVQTPGYYHLRYSVTISGSPTDGGAFVQTGPNNPAGTGVVSSTWPGSASAAPPSNDYNTVAAGGVLPFYMYQGDFVQVMVIPFDAGQTTIGTDEYPFMSLEWISA